MTSIQDYRIFQPPQPLNFYEWTTQEARTYFNWFIAQIPERLKMLRTLAVDLGVSETSLDLTPESMPALGFLLGSMTSKRIKDVAETLSEREAQPEWMRPYLEDWTLSQETLSVCVDCGIYFAEALRLRHPKLKWDFVRRGKSNIEFHQPVLVPFPHGVELNPVSIMTVVAFGHTRGKPAAARLPEVYHVWESKAEQNF